jgi:hypothetical protein
LLFQKDNSNRKDTHFWNVKRGGMKNKGRTGHFVTAGQSEKSRNVRRKMYGEYLSQGRKIF